jgi:trimethylamine--corrinoid protein Co-methyltransferase
MDLSGCNVHMGSGGASPSIVDLDTGLYRDSTLKDLYDAARLVDTLDNIHFFSRSLVARDMPTDQLLDINTAYACLAGTAKHVCVSACNGDNAREIARMCYSLAGSRQAFEEKPFLSFNINHVVPPLRFHEQSCDVLEQCALGGIPAHANSFGQIGASSPVHLAGSVAQSMAESIAGGIFAWLVNPAARVIFGPKPMITDLRTGGLSGGGGEQAIATAAVTQLARYYDLPCVSIAGATDSKIADAQSGYEKCLSVNLAAQAGSNLITQAAGVQASLMSVALESYVIDNDMLGGIMRSLKPLEISDDALSTEAIDSVVRSEGHFLGEADTYARMRSDFLYPDIADRRTAAEWEDDGARDIREVAIQKTRDILASHFPDHLAQADETLREQFDIRLPVEAMTGS